MNKRLILILIGVISGIYLHAKDNEAYSRTYMYTRPASDHLNQQNFLWSSTILTKEGSISGALQFIPFVQGSISKDKFARYFMPTCQNEILWSGDDNTADLLIRNVRAEYFNLPANFRGIMTLKPQQTQYGVILEYCQELGKLLDNSSFFANSWIDIRMPLIGVINDLNLCEFAVENPSPTFPQSIPQAMNQPSYHAAKIRGKKEVFLPSEIKIYLGKTFLDSDFFEISFSTIALIPLGNHHNEEYLFSPVVGNDRHFAFGGNVHFQLLLNRHPEKGIAWTFFADLEGCCVSKIKNVVRLI